jgi:hypothetical protein
MRKSPLIVAMFASTLCAAALAGEKQLSFEWLWTHTHTTPGQISEIPAFDPLTNTLWIAGVVGVDVLDADSGVLLQHIDVTSHGFVNSVAIHKGVAAFAVEAFSRAPGGGQPAAGNRRDPGKVLFYDTATMAPSSGVTQIGVGSLPDSLTFSHDGTRLLVANEGTPNQAADQPYVITADVPDPAGTVSIINMTTRTLIATAGLAGVPITGTRVRTNVGMDFEPEYIAIDPTGRQAWVTLQEANAIGVLDLQANVFTNIIGLGAKSFAAPGPQLDPCDTPIPPAAVNCGPNATSFINASVNGLYMPDSIAAYRFRGDIYTVSANEGDFREDNVDRSAASSFGAVAPLTRLRVSNADSTAGSLFAAGARSFSIRDADGNLVFDSGDTLDKAAAAVLAYDDSRSRDKGMEPEGIALLKISGRTFAFIGLERTLTSVVAVFDITDPFAVDYRGLVVTPGSVSPEGLAAYHHNGDYYLAIAHEVSNTTALYRIDTINPNGK